MFSLFQPRPSSQPTHPTPTPTPPPFFLLSISFPLPPTLPTACFSLFPQFIILFFFYHNILLILRASCSVVPNLLYLCFALSYLLVYPLRFSLVPGLYVSKQLYDLWITFSSFFCRLSFPAVCIFLSLSFSRSVNPPLYSLQQLL